MPKPRKVFEIRAQWDGEAGVWWCANDELPLTTEAPTFEQLVARVLEIAPEIAAENGLAAPGDDIDPCGQALVGRDRIDTRRHERVSKAGSGGPF